MAALGATAAYAYHWNQDGNSADATIKRLQRNQDYGKLYIVPTVSDVYKRQLQYESTCKHRRGQDVR